MSPICPPVCPLSLCSSLLYTIFRVPTLSILAMVMVVMVVVVVVVVVVVLVSLALCILVCSLLTALLGLSMSDDSAHSVAYIPGIQIQQSSLYSLSLSLSLSPTLMRRAINLLKQRGQEKGKERYQGERTRSTREIQFLSLLLISYVTIY